MRISDGSSDVCSAALLQASIATIVPAGNCSSQGARATRRKSLRCRLRPLASCSQTENTSFARSSPMVVLVPMGDFSFALIECATQSWHSRPNGMAVGGEVSFLLVHPDTDSFYQQHAIDRAPV